MKKTLVMAAGTLLSLVLAGCSFPEEKLDRSEALVEIPAALMEAHDFSLADTPNKRTALAYLYTAWNDGKVAEARRTYWVPGSFPELEGDAPPPGPPPGLPPNIGSPQYTMKQVIEEDDRVVVLALVEGVGIGDEITTIFGTPGGTKIGDAVVEIMRFDTETGLIAEKWDIIEPMSEQSYDFR